jgi:gamma-glutamylcyclotransferase (GGCT)/AIG2-like uncharacterized protein YtfP
MRTVFYFAFGANLDPEVLKGRKIVPLSAQDFSLRDYQLHFTQAGPYVGMGFASIVNSPGSTTYGKLYQLDQLDMHRMDYFEAVPFMHRHKKKFTEQDGQLLYFYQATNPVAGLSPSKEYLQKILTGLSTFKNIPSDYLEKLRLTPTVATNHYADNHQMFLQPCGWLPEAWRCRLDQLLIRFYVNVLRRYSITERWIH